MADHIKSSSMRVMCNRLNLFTVVGAYATLALIAYLSIFADSITEGHQWLIGELVALLGIAQGIASGGKVGQKFAETKEK